MTGSALAFPTPASLGSLDHYIQAVNRFPLLSAEQETELGRRWRQAVDGGDVGVQIAQRGHHRPRIRQGDGGCRCALVQ